MTTINFPSNPQVDDVYGFGSRSWRYNGNAWVSSGQVTGFTGSQGIQGIPGSIGFTGSQGTLTSVRVVTAGVTSGNITPTADTADQYHIFGLTDAVTILPPSGTPNDGQRLMFRIKDNGTSRGITWTTSGTNSYRPFGVALPPATTPNKLTYVGCVYNSQDSFWDVIAVTTQT